MKTSSNPFTIEIRKCHSLVPEFIFGVFIHNQDAAKKMNCLFCGYYTEKAATLLAQRLAESFKSGATGFESARIEFTEREPAFA